MSFWVSRITWTDPYSEEALKSAEERWSFKFPPDLKQLFLNKKPTGLGVWDWDKITDADFRGAQEHIVMGFAFDAVYSDFWYDLWGSKPFIENPPSHGDSSAVAEFCEPIAQVIRAHMDKTAKAIPICGHRYLPTSPNSAGLPILSIMQTDIIYYGLNLRDYFYNEFGEDIGQQYGEIIERDKQVEIPVIEFWSDFLSSTRNFP